MGTIHRVLPAEQPGAVFWFYGSSGSGKTRMATGLSKPGWLVIDADDWPSLDNSMLARMAHYASKQGLNVCVASDCSKVHREVIKKVIPWMTWVYVEGPHE